MKVKAARSFLKTLGLYRAVPTLVKIRIPYNYTILLTYFDTWLHKSKCYNFNDCRSER